MHKISLFLAFLFTFNACHMSDSNPMIIGKVKPSTLQQEPYKSSWYQKSYDEYVLNPFNVKTDSIKVNVFFGSWCGDCHKQLPRFMKLAEEHSIFYDIYGLDLQKKSKKGFEQGKNIHHVPTFIVLKDGKEIGRIIETPVVSLEADLAAIINNEEYTPNHNF